MKTSNKILVGAFIVALLILISVHVTLYARYKKGEFTLVSNEWQLNLATLSLDNVKYLSVDNIDNINVHLSDSSKLMYDKPDEGDQNRLSFTKKNDTLFVTAKANNASIRWYRRADLYLSQNLSSKFINSEVHLSKRKGRLNSQVLSLDLDNSVLNINALGSEDAVFPALNISARNKSHIAFNKAYLKNLSVSLKDSFLEEKELQADSITITTDPLSTIGLRARNLTKAKLTDHE